MSQYAHELPVDKQNNPYLVSMPSSIANQAWSSVFTVSSVAGFSDKTTTIQLTAIARPLIYKWVSIANLGASSSVTGTSFDGVVPAAYSQILVIPQSVMAVGYSSSMMGANGANGLYNGIAIKQTAINGSVFCAEY